MGRLNLSAIRVRQTALAQHQCGKMERKPCWVDVIGDIPPASVLVRTLPQEHPIVRERIKRVAGEPKRVAFAQSAPATTRNPRRLFMPREIRYEEDRLRQKFFQDHPWELARPKVVLESKGNEWRQYDWSKIQQPGKPLDGESVVQHQLWLLNNTPNMTVTKAYDIARRKFYKLRHQEDVERRVAEEEATWTGAYFGPTLTERGMEMENEVYNRWKAWAEEETALYTQRSNSMLGIDSNETPPGEDLNDAAPAEEEEVPVPITVMI